MQHTYWELLSSTALLKTSSYYREDIMKTNEGRHLREGLCLRQLNVPVAGCDDRGKQQEESWQSCRAGVGNAPRTLHDGLSHSVFWAAVPGAAADARPWLHTTCLWGLNHKRRTAGGFAGKKHRLYYTETHKGGWQRSRLLERWLLFLK